MEISTAHQRFSERLNNPEALNDPEKFLGPNYQKVLNFWLYLDKLTNEQRKEHRRRWRDLDDDTCYKAQNAARDAADEVIGRTNRYAAYWSAPDYCGRATLELIANIENPVFLRLFVNLQDTSTTDTSSQDTSP